MMGSKAMFDWRCNELKAQTHAKFFLPFSHFNFLGLVAQSSFLGLACVFRFQLCLWDFRPNSPPYAVNEVKTKEPTQHPLAAWPPTHAGTDYLPAGSIRAHL